MQEQRAPLRRSSEQELWFGIAGVVVVACTLAIIILAVGAVTIFRDPAAETARFGQCYSAGGADCVVDGDTLFVGRERVEISGLAAPRVQGARCPAERDRGVAAALALSALLKGGDVTIGPPMDDPFGREVRKVMVGGSDAGERMIAGGHARRFEGQEQNWCG